MVLQLIQNLLHLESRWKCLNEHSCTDTSLLDTELASRKAERVVPKSRFEVVFHLREVEVRARTPVDELAGVVEEVETEVEKGAGHGCTVDDKAGFVKVPASRSGRCQRGAAILERKRTGRGGPRASQSACTTSLRSRSRSPGCIGQVIQSFNTEKSHAHRTASRRFACPRTKFDQVGEVESE